MSSQSRAAVPPQRAVRVSRRAGTRLLSAALFFSVVGTSPALAEVCDKADGASAGYLMMVAVLILISVVAASAFRVVWPGYVLAGVIALMAASGLYDLMNGDIVADAAWREGCGQRSLMLDGASIVLVIGLAYWARRRASS